MLEIQNLTKVYTPKKGVPVKALDAVNLKFEETGMVFILGKSGSGKTTLLNLIGGLDTVTDGDVIIKGKSSANFTQGDFDSYRNTFIGFVFQEYNILNEFSVGKNISLALELQNKKSNDQAVDTILEQVDLQGYANRKPNELSGGQKQRVAIARALIKDPEIIMADEPTGALDSNTGKQVFETLQKLSETKLVIIVSHDRDYAEFYGDRVIELADGKVISDIKKYKTQSHSISSDVNIIDDKIMHIKSGHKISDAEMNQIKTFLESGSGDLILSKDEKANDDFKRLARIDEEGNKESFEQTSEKNQTIKEYDPNKFKMIRSRLPNRHAFKMGASSLKIKPFRLVVAILMSAVAFALFGLADAISAYNKYTVTYNSMRELNLSTTAFVKEFGSMDEEGDTRSSIYKMSETEANNIREKFPSHTFDELLYSGDFDQYSENTLLSYGRNVFDFFQPTNNHKVGVYYKHGFSSGMNFGGVVEVKPSDIVSDRFRGYNIIGDYPKEKNEVMISKHVYEAFQDLGYLDLEAYLENASEEFSLSQKITITSEQQLLGKTILLGDDNIAVKIVGIIDTLFPDNYERYKDANTQSSTDPYKFMFGQNEIAALFYFGYHGALYVAPESVDLFKYTDELSNYYKLGNETSLTFIDSENYFRTNFSYASNIEVLDESINVHFADLSKTTLQENEVLLSIKSALRICDPYRRWQNSYGEIENQQEFIDDFFEEFFSDTTSITISGHFQAGSKGDETDFNIVGIIDGIEEADFDSYFIVLSDTRYDSLLEIERGDIVALITNLPASKSAQMKMIKFSYKQTITGIDDRGDKTYTRFQMKNSVTETLRSVEGYLKNLTPMFFYIGISCAVFASILLMNFIMVSISYKKREIGILRAVGAKSWDVMKIFFFESLLLALIGFVLASIGAGIGAIFTNYVLRTDYGIIISVVSFGLRQIALILGVSVLVAAISSFLPVYLTSRKKPVETIRNA